MAILPAPDRAGNRVFVGRLSNPEPSQYNFVAAVKAMQLVIETSLREEGAAPGYVFVYDQKGVQLGHIARMPLSAVRKYLTYVQVRVVAWVQLLAPAGYFFIFFAPCSTRLSFSSHCIFSGPWMFQEGLAIKMKAIHVINMNPVGERFLNMVKPLMKKELYNMV